ncbi:hypothetical protein OG210_21995 [Streptomyces sp. NBC_00466]|uniref:hypothetical protein n=1 Tax=Streptomyces sp. NBC_00466 TaxID=2903655 RepID=UPI0030E55435
MPKEMKRRVPWEVFGETGPRGRTLTTAVTLDGLKRMVGNSRRASSMNLAAELGMEMVYVPTPETEVLRILAAALKPLEFVEEHRVGEYTVDAYLPGINVVIERDRSLLDRNAEWWRQTFIEDRLGCSFVRFDPKRRDFNVGDIVNQILTIELPERTEQSA